MHQKIITHPITKESLNITQWANRLGVPTSTMAGRYKRHGSKKQIFSNCRMRSGYPQWKEREDRLLQEVWLLPDFYSRYKKEAEELGCPMRSTSAIKDRVAVLRKQGKIPIKKGNLQLAIDAGYLNETQLANCLGISPPTARRFLKQGHLKYQIGKDGNYYIYLKDFAVWAKSEIGSILLAKAIKQDQEVIAWVLRIIGKWL
jgi:hypothetical protein